MLRMLGVVLTFGNCSALGFCLCKHAKKRVCVLLELRKMAVMLAAEIRYTNAAMEEAFMRIVKRIQGPTKTFLQHLLESMEKQQEGTLGDLFAMWVERDLSGSGLQKDELEALKLMGSQLGYLDTQMEIKNVEFYLEQVNHAWHQASAEYQKKEKLFRLMGVSAGFFFIILFY